MSLKAPYNFVPLNTTVVKPHWTNYISHDLPFEDAQSGHLEIELTTHSPLYVRNGVMNGQPDTEKVRFNHHQGRYFIPGSSLKGMIRSVVEIMSFGRITDKLNDVTLAQRDFSNKDKSFYPKETFAKEIHCGWLKAEGDQYLVKDCGKPGRITHEVLSRIARNSSGQTISEYYSRYFDATKADLKTAKSKHDLFFTTISTKEYGFEQDYEAKPGGLTKYTLVEPGQRRGRIVCTGQPARVVPKAGPGMAKHSEFIFFTSNAEFKPVDERVIKNLKVAFFDREKNESLDWKWRKAQLENGQEIPVFFRLDEHGKVKDMGLSFLYKMTYDYSTKQLANQNEDDGQTAPDLADAIFGYVEGQLALKGRVQIGHAFVQGNATPLEQRNDVLAGPKATYYPTYIRQEGNGSTVSKYATYKDEYAPISGWKRYPIRANGSVNSNPAPTRGDGTINTDVASTFTPLQAGATFRFRVNYHNLRKEELGALISAITFHNTPDTYHSLGLAKPLGYGKVSLKILHKSDEELKECLRAFEGFMRSEVNDWHTSEQMRELVAMAMPKANAELTGYMDLQGFLDAKKQNEYLRKHSQIYKFGSVLSSLLSEDEVKEKRELYSAERTHFVNVDATMRIQLKHDEKQRDLNALKDDWRKIIQEKQEEIKKQEEQREREAKIQKAVEGGPDFSLVRISDKKALDQTRQAMVKYGKGARNCSENALREFTNGYALEIHHTLIVEHFRALYQHLSDKDKIAWKKDHSDARKYLRQWIGPDKVIDVFNNLL